MTNLTNRKELASRTLGVGKNKIIFDNARMDEIKEAITKQDIRELYASGAITIKEKGGRRKKDKRTTRRGPGKIKKTIFRRKENYVITTRKLRKHIQELRKQGKLNRAQYYEFRKKIKTGIFKTKAHLKENIGEQA